MSNRSDGQPAMGALSNSAVAANLGEMADLLQQQEADFFRVQAYRHASNAVAALQDDLGDIFEAESIEGLVALPAVGTSIANAISEMLRTGRWAHLERLRGAASPESLFRTVPGIGPKLASKLHDELHLDTLEALEVAAYDGTLQKLPGFGNRRIAMIRTSLQERLGRRRIRHNDEDDQPSVRLILDVDREYRQRVAMDDLRKIAPKRFNPAGKAWLHVLHTGRDGWMFTAMFSNTQRAHQLNRSHDWVVIYYHSDGAPEGQCTVVTETIGHWRGWRVVRGREVQCADYYQHHGAAA